MSVSVTPSFISYTADGSVGATYSIPFDILDATHLDMYIDGVATVGGKTVNGIGTGTVTVNTDVDYAQDVVVLFKRNVPYGQESVFVEGESMPMNKLTTAIDSVAMQVQQIKEIGDLSLKAGPAETPPLGTVVLAADTTLGQDATGTLINRTVAQEVTHLGIGASVTAAALSETNAAASEAAAATSETNAAASEAAALVSEGAAETSNINASAAVLDLATKSFSTALFSTGTGDSVITGDVVITLTGSPDITIKNSARPYTEDNAISGVGAKLSQLWPDIVNIIQGNYTDYDTAAVTGNGNGPTISNPNPITAWDVGSYKEPYSDTTFYELVYYGSEATIDLSTILPSPYLATPSTLTPPSDLPFLGKTATAELSVTERSNLASQWPEADGRSLINTLFSVQLRLEALEKKNFETAPVLPTALAIYHAGAIGDAGVADGDEILFLKDSSGNGRHGIGVTTTTPTYVEDDGNGNPAMAFAGTDWITLPDTLKITDSVTIFAVISRPSATSFIHQTLLGQQDLSGSLFLQAYATTLDAIVSNGSTGTPPADRFVYRGQTAFDIGDTGYNNRAQLLTYRRSGSGAADQMGKGDCLPLNEAISPIGIAITAQGTPEIGRRGATSGEYFTGNLYALHIYPTLTDEEVGQVQSYLSEKFQSHLNEAFYLEYLAAHDLWTDTGEIPTDPTQAGGHVDQDSSTNGWLVQGICRGNDDIYYISYNRILFGGDAWIRKCRRDSSGEFVFLSDHELTEYLPESPASLGATIRPATQMNGLDFRDGFLYVGANNYLNSDGASQPYGRGWVLKVRVSDMAVVQTSADLLGVGEGGAWFKTADGWRFCAINHESDTHHILDEDLALVTSYDPAAYSTPHPSNNLFYQSCMFMHLNGSQYAIKPNHNGGLEDKIDIHEWTGSGFNPTERMDAAVVYPGQLISRSGQGMNWDRPPSTYAHEGGKTLIVRRLDDRRDQAVACYLGVRRTGETIHT